MIDTSRFAMQKVAMSRINRVGPMKSLDRFDKEAVKNEQQKGDKRAGVEIRDRIEIKDRKYISTENWLG